MDRLRLHIHPGPVPGVEVQGDLCISSAAMLEACVVRLIAGRPGAALVLDARRVTFCDVAGLRCLGRIADAARGHGVALEVRPSPAIARLERLVLLLAPVRAA